VSYVSSHLFATTPVLVQKDTTENVISLYGLDQLMSEFVTIFVHV